MYSLHPYKLILLYLQKSRCHMETEKILIKCDNTIFADEIKTALEENGIASRQHDDCCDSVRRQIGITIFVYAEDYDKACDVIAPIISERNKAKHMCPKCGSEDVRNITTGIKHGNALSIIAIFSFLLPGVYIGLPNEMMVHNDALDVIALLLFILGIVLLVMLSRKSKNYECRKCGKKFYHVD